MCCCTIQTTIIHKILKRIHGYLPVENQWKFNKCRSAVFSCFTVSCRNPCIWLLLIASTDYVAGAKVPCNCLRRHHSSHRWNPICSSNYCGVPWTGSQTAQWGFDIVRVVRSNQLHNPKWTIKLFIVSHQMARMTCTMLQNSKLSVIILPNPHTKKWDTFFSLSRIHSTRHGSGCFYT